MTNTEALFELIDSKGLKRKYVAERIGLTYYGFMRKANNQSEFKSSEISALCDLLEIKNLKEKERLFFAKKDDLKSS